MIVSNLYRILCSTSNMFSFDIWNYYYSELCLPITLLIVFQLIVGVLGSVTVLFLYQKRLKSKWHKSRFFFISILGTLDFICVSFQIDDVYHKLQLTHFVTFPSSWSCYSFLMHNFSNCYGLYNDNDSDCSNQILFNLPNHEMSNYDFTITDFHFCLQGYFVLSPTEYIPTIFVFETVKVHK